MSGFSKKFPNALKAARYLSKADPKLAQVIKEVGAVKIELDFGESVFQSLLTSIVYQQLHGKAAASILARFIVLFGKGKAFPSPRRVLEMEESLMRGAGLSQNKINAIRDLAKKVLDGTVPSRLMAEKMTDEELILAVTQVKGIGVWTAQMLLIFTLGRPDVLPAGDYGVRKGFARVYRKKKMPAPKELEKACEHWRPYRSVGSWYLWRSLEL
jgi:DNA-3-methyladenine glycosylase II